MRHLYWSLSLLPVCFLTVLVPTPELRAGTAHSECGWETCACKRNLFDLRSRLRTKTEKPPGNGRQYARDRLVDVRHQKIEVTPDFKARSVRGISTIRFSPIAKAAAEIQLDAVDLTVSKIESNRAIASWDNDDRKITILFQEPIPPGQEAQVTVHYSASPREGLYFRTEAMGYPAGDDHLWTQGEPEKHRHWFPGYDFPNERFTTEVICHVPEEMTVLSNGNLISDNVKDGVRTVHWHQKKEHVNYLISLVAGHFKKLEDKHGELPLAFYTPPSMFHVAENSFRDTADILPFLEKEIGVPFPWAKYYNICVTDFIAGGMENTSVTTLSHLTLFSADSENLRTSHRLDAHEVTHQWFGDLLTCKDWSHLWLNEGFATYYTHLYEARKNGEDAKKFGLYKDLERVTGQKSDKPIVWREFSDPWEQFDFRAYPKGSWVLHMLRSQLGPELFQKCIETYVKRYTNQIVETSDLQEVFEELSGRNFDEFFDQWVYHGGTPHLEVKYQWNAKNKRAKITVRQTQKISSNVLLFDFELPLRFVDEEGAVHDRVAHIQKSSEEFSYSLPSRPRTVRIDPELTVLTKIDFNPPRESLNRQLQNGDDMIGRLLAVKSLATKKDAAALQSLKKALNEDPFHGVRIEAAKSLQKHRTPEAFQMLEDSLEQEDARVRKQVVEAIGKYFSSDALTVLRKISENETNPEIVAEALAAAGKYPEGEVRELLTSALQRPSFRHQIAVKAVAAMKNQASPAYAPILLEHIGASKDKFSSRDLGPALGALAYVSKDAAEDVRTRVRDFLAGYLNHPNPLTQTSAARALGETEDKRALGILQAYATGNESDPVVKAAAEAVKKINGGQRQAAEVKDLRALVMELQKKIDQLSNQVESKEE